MCAFVGPDGVPDANPEVVIIGVPLDGSKSPQVAVGQKFEDITGVVFQQLAPFSTMFPKYMPTNLNRFGFFYVMPLTAPKLASSPSFVAPVTNVTAASGACQVTIGDYNVRMYNVFPIISAKNLSSAD